MGPRFANRGYQSSGFCFYVPVSRFNGSTVREPWLSQVVGDGVRDARQLQWGHGSRTVVMATTASDTHTLWIGLQWVHDSRTVVIKALFMAPTPPPHSFNGSTVREPWLSHQRR